MKKQLAKLLVAGMFALCITPGVALAAENTSKEALATAAAATPEAAPVAEAADAAPATENTNESAPEVGGEQATASTAPEGVANTAESDALETSAKEIAPSAEAKVENTLAANAEAEDATHTEAANASAANESAEDTNASAATEGAAEDTNAVSAESTPSEEASTSADASTEADTEATTASEPSNQPVTLQVAASAAPAEVQVASSKAPVAADADADAFFEDGSIYLISSANTKAGGRALDVAGGSTKAGANIWLYDYNATLAQFWRAVYKGSGIYNFISHKSSNMLAWQGGTTAMTNVQTAASGNVDWKVYKNTDGTYSLGPASNTDMRLDVAGAGTKNGTNIWLYYANGTPAQAFNFTKSKGLTEAMTAGKPVNEGIVEVALTSNNNLRVDIAGASRANLANAQLEIDSNELSQKYQMSYVGNGLYELKDANSTKCLDVIGGSLKENANVHQYTRNQTIAQYWYLEKNGSGYTIKSASNGNALTAASASNGANIRMNSFSNSANQRFSIVATQLIDDGVYVIQSDVITPMVLGVKGGSTQAQANVQTSRSDGSTAQQFRIRHVGNGAYTIQNVKSGLYVDVAGASTKACGNVWQYFGNGTDAQKWIAELGEPGTFLFKSVKSGMYLDVAGSSSLSGANVWQYHGNATPAQAWVLHDKDWKFYPNDTSLSNLRVLTKAEEYEGWPYQWGGRSPFTSFDCAGLVMYCANEVWGTNFDLMYTNAERLYSLCTPISESEARPGDLVFYRGTYGSDINYISHVVFYAGRGIMYGAGDPIGYDVVNAPTNIRGQSARYMFARIRH